MGGERGVLLGGGRLFEAGRLFEVGAKSRLGAYSNKYGSSVPLVSLLMRFDLIRESLTFLV